MQTSPKSSEHKDKKEKSYIYSLLDCDKCLNFKWSVVKRSIAHAQRPSPHSPLIILYWRLNIVSAVCGFAVNRGSAFVELCISALDS